MAGSPKCHSFRLRSAAGTSKEEEGSEQKPVRVEAQTVGPVRGGRKRPRRESSLLPKKPKKAASAYSNFIKAYYKKNKDSIGNREKFRQASKAWHEVGSDERAAMDKKCAKDRERYQKEMAIWKKKQAFLKRPPTSYGLFVRDMWATEKPTVGSKEEFQANNANFANRWKELGDKKKQEYQARYATLKRHHGEKMWHVRQTGLPNLNWMTQGLPLQEADPIVLRRSARLRALRDKKIEECRQTLLQKKI